MPQFEQNPEARLVLYMSVETQDYPWPHREIQEPECPRIPSGTMRNTPA